MAVEFFNLAGMGCSATGTSVLTLTSALPGFSSFADAGVTNGDEVRYLVKDGDNREIGTGTYTASGVSVSRDTVLLSISSGTVGTSKISLSGGSEVYLTLAKEDLSALTAIADFTAANTLPSDNGTDGQVLTSDGAGGTAWESAGGGGGLVPISKTTASASSAVDISLTGGYSAYLLRLEHVRFATNLASAQLRTSTNGGSSFDSGASDYGYSAVSMTTTVGSEYDNANGFIKLTSSNGNASGNALNGEILIVPADGTSYTAITYALSYYGSVAVFGIWGSGQRLNATAVDAVRFYASSGNITSGDFHLYGIADGA